VERRGVERLAAAMLDGVRFGGALRGAAPFAAQHDAGPNETMGPSEPMEPGGRAPHARPERCAPVLLLSAAAHQRW
jgi:hypothetical protein